MSKTMATSIPQKRQLRRYLEVFEGTSYVPVSNLDAVIIGTYNLFDSASISSHEEFIKSIGRISCKPVLREFSLRTKEEEACGNVILNEKELNIIRNIWKKIAFNTIINHSTSCDASIKISKVALRKIYAKNRFSYSEAANHLKATIASFLKFEGFDGIEISSEDIKSYVIFLVKIR